MKTTYDQSKFDRWLRKLKLVENFTTEVVMPKQDFYTRLKQNVDRDTTGPFAGLADVFSSSKNEYKGEVSLSSFKLKKKRKLFDFNQNIAEVTGQYQQEGDVVKITGRIAGFRKTIIPFVIMALVFYGIFVSVIISTDVPAFVLPFILVHAAMMFGIPYVLMRRSVTRMSHELEREFHYLSKNTK